MSSNNYELEIYYVKNNCAYIIFSFIGYSMKYLCDSMSGIEFRTH